MTLYDQTQYVRYLSPTEDGRQHDKKLAAEYAPSLPIGSVLRQGLGHAPAGVVVEMPYKKPPKRELLFSQKRYNHLLSPLRVVIEHAHSGIKRLRTVADMVRLRGEPVRDLVMVVVCGLYNLRVCSPLARLPRASAPEALQFFRIRFIERLTTALGKEIGDFSFQYLITERVPATYL